MNQRTTKEYLATGGILSLLCVSAKGTHKMHIIHYVGMFLINRDTIKDLIAIGNILS